MAEGLAVVDRARCIGCGLCVSGCPSEAARLEKRPDAEAIHPPVDFAAWESERLRYRQAHQH
jgi:ferredoxin